MNHPLLPRANARPPPPEEEVFPGQGIHFEAARRGLLAIIKDLQNTPGFLVSVKGLALPTRPHERCISVTYQPKEEHGGGQVAVFRPLEEDFLKEVLYRKACAKAGTVQARQPGEAVDLAFDARVPTKELEELREYLATPKRFDQFPEIDFDLLRGGRIVKISQEPTAGSLACVIMGGCSEERPWSPSVVYIPELQALCMLLLEAFYGDKDETAHSVAALVINATYPHFRVIQGVMTRGPLGIPNLAVTVLMDSGTQHREFGHDFSSYHGYWPTCQVCLRRLSWLHFRRDAALPDPSLADTSLPSAASPDAPLAEESVPGPSQPEPEGETGDDDVRDDGRNISIRQLARVYPRVLRGYRPRTRGRPRG